MAEIDVQPAGEDTYRVVVAEAGSSASYEVTAQPGDVARFGGGRPAEQLVAASFRFLLDREPKESILRRFDLTVIEQYFPEYAAKIEEYL